MNPEAVSEPQAQAYATKNRIQDNDQPIHSWYRFVLGYPPHLVREYLERLDADPQRDCVFDPFCGTATTPVEARLHGFQTLSCDANPMSVLAARAKLCWDIDLAGVRARLREILVLAVSYFQNVGLAPVPEASHQLPLFPSPTMNVHAPPPPAGENEFRPEEVLAPGAFALIPRGFISRKPMLRVLALRSAIDTVEPETSIRDFLMLALANTIVLSAGNVGFGPEVYRLAPRDDADVLGVFVNTVEGMIFDLERLLKGTRPPFPPSHVLQDDARTLTSIKDSPPVGITITSPPYPNEKDYTRTTRLESVLLGLIRTKKDLRAVKSMLLRSNTRNVFSRDDDDRCVTDIRSVTHLAEQVEKRRVQLGKTSGFERLYPRVVLLYFGGMYRHLASLLPKLRRGAKCAYVLGDQMSYLRVHIRTASVLADIATRLGYHVEGIELWRTRRSTATGLDLEENVLIMQAPKAKRQRND